MSYSIKRWFSIALMGMALPHAVAFADMSQSVAPPMRVALFEPGFVFCYEGGGCVAPWSSLALPSLSINESLSITTESTDFNFYLGNNLSGSFAVLLSPAYPSDFLQNQDELRANVATSDGVLGATNGGAFNFSASTGIQYYLLLSGEMRGDQTYSVSVSAIPEPEPYALLTIGLGILVLRITRKSRIKHDSQQIHQPIDFAARYLS